MSSTFHDDEPLPYSRLKHHTCWPSAPLSEEYLIPPEDKQRILEQLYPFVEAPGLDDTLLDIHEEKEFVVRDFKVVREGGMNMLVSPYYYRSGGSVIDWVPVNDPSNDGEEPEDDDQDEEGFGLFSSSMTAQRVKPGGEARLVSLMKRQHEGPGF